MLSCQEHGTMGTEDGSRGIRGWGFAQNVCLGGVAIFPPCGLFMQTRGNQAVIWHQLTTHHLIPDFWSVPHILINSCMQ